MLETAAELEALQALLDRSRAGATRHLRGIIGDDRALDASGTVAALPGMRTITLATVTAGGEPRTSAVDGHFLHGRWVFGTDRRAAKARHLLARPAASVAYVVGEEVGVWTHGHVTVLHDDPSWPATLAHLTQHYGKSPLEWGDVVYFRLEPTWMVAFAGG